MFSPLLSHAQAEAFALETNCWVHVVAQHQTSGEDFYSYISPRLLRDDNEGVNYIQQVYSRLFAGVKKAARTEAMEMMKQLTEQREAAEAAERERKELQERNETLENLLRSLAGQVSERHAQGLLNMD